MATNRFKNKLKEEAKEIVAGDKPKAVKEEKVIKEEKDTIVTTRVRKNKEKKESDKNTIIETGVNKKERKSAFGLSKKEAKKETAILSVKLNEDVAEAFESEKSITKKTASAIATELLTKIYDEETNTFSIDVAANKKTQSKDTTLNLPGNIKKALADNAEARNMKIYEYFNKLMEAILEQ